MQAPPGAPLIAKEPRVSVEKYLKPQVINQIKRLDLRAQFVVKGFLQGLHASPFHGFSVEFSEHRRYNHGDDPKDIDWLVYAKTDKYYVRKYEAETNITGYLMMDLSRSMGYTFRQDLTKFDYCVCLAASLAYLMIHQQDPVGLLTFDSRIRTRIEPRSKRTHLGTLLSHLAKLEPSGETGISESLGQVAALLRHRTLLMVFSDLLTDADSLLRSLHVLRHGGHDVILFHVLDEAEVTFPFQGMVELEDPETGELVEVDASAYQPVYEREIGEFRERLRRDCAKSGIDYVPLDTSISFDKALLEYLLSRRSRM
ncbi:MAG: DUF58 domain-containing protein [Planctomycetales bacterium]|nr:DUF58 domain-containing protein [Planctomycetales bacterium]